LRPTKQNPIDLNHLDDETLLDFRICDLNLELKGGHLEKCVQRLYQELKEKHLNLRPPCYLGDEWFSPDGIPAIAIPFYLAHPRLQILEQHMMLEVEGGTDEECMKLLRHECGHALAHAYKLMNRKSWIKEFGSPKKAYQEFYRYRPYSKSYVHHLKDWYAQSHPEEDFAETFAVWLNPENDWRHLYEGWPALKKLLYINQLVKVIKNKPPKVSEIIFPFQINNLKRKLRTHYEQRKKLYAEEDIDYFDDDLKKIFNSRKKGHSAALFLRRHQKEIQNAAFTWTQERKFMIKRLLTKLIRRCQDLELQISDNQNSLLIEFSTYFSSLVSNYVFTSRYKCHP